MNNTYLERLVFFLSLNRVPIALVIVCLVPLLSVVPYLEAEKIERRIQRQVRHAVSALQTDNVLFAVRGRELSMHGNVPNLSTKNRLTEEVLRLDGIRSINFDLDVAPDRTPYLRVVREDMRKVRLVGELPRLSDIEHVLKVVSLVIPADQLTNDLVVNPKVADPLWHSFLGPALKYTAAMQRFTLNFDLGRVVLSGIHQDQSDYAAMIDGLHQLARNGGFRFVNRVGW